MPLYDPQGSLLYEQQTALELRKQRLQEQAAQAAKRAGVPLEAPEVGGWTSAVTGTRLPGRQLKAPVFSGVANLINDTIGRDFREQRYAADRQEFERRNREAAIEQLRRMPGEKIKETTTQMAPGAYGTNTVPQQVETERPTTMQDRLAWAADASQVPALRSTTDAYIADQVVKEPERIAAREAARAKQQEELQYRRERDAEANDLRRTIADALNANRLEIAGMRGGRGGGGGGGGGGGTATPGITLTDENGNEVPGWARKNVKASEIVKDVDSAGNVTLTDKLTGQRLKVGGGGKSSAGHDKAEADAITSVSNAKDGLALLESMKPLFDKATTFGLKDTIEGAVKYGTGYATDSQAALKDLGIKAANLAKYADRKMFGPQFTDADVKAINKAVGNFGEATSYKERLAAYNAVKEIFERQAKVPTTFSQDTNQRRDANKPGGGGGRDLKFNPATGRLE